VCQTSVQFIWRPLDESRVAAGALLPTTFNISGPPPLHARISSPTLSPGWPEPLKAFMYNRKRAMPVLSSISEKGPAPQPQIHLAVSLFKEEHGLSLFLSVCSFRTRRPR
jgi:hypothetical protein